MQRILGLLLIGFLFASCEKDEENTSNENPNPQLQEVLVESGLLGNWEILDRTFGVITPPIAICCEYMSFSDDTISTDLKGLFTYEGNGEDVEGTFTMDTIQSKLFFEYGNNERTFGFAIDSNQVLFTYTEEDVEVFETWFRVE
jgi:hypothetical protein